MRKLYRAHIEFDMVVYADTEAEAVDLIESYASHEIGTEIEAGAASVDGPYLIRHHSQIPAGWAGSYPYGGAGEQVVARLFDAQKEADTE